MRTSLRGAPAIVAVVLAVTSLGAQQQRPDTRPEHLKQMDRMLAEGENRDERAEILVRLAWIDEETSDELSAAAVEKLEGWGRHSIWAMRMAIRRVPPEHLADLVSTMIAARHNGGPVAPKDYLPALEEATWFGTRDARKRAIPQLALARYRPSLLTIMDAAVEDPDLVPVAIAALSRMGDDRARFYLGDVLRESGPGIREPAAVALATIGGRALVPLKAAVRSEDRELRLAAVRSLLPVATVDDLSVLHEYAYTYPDDDPVTVTAVRESAIALEKRLFEMQSADSASPLPE